MKEKLVTTFGAAGMVLWYIISFVFCFAPIFYIRMPFIVRIIIVGVVMFIPFVGEIIRCLLYIWAFFSALGGTIDGLSILFFVLFALYMFTLGIPMIGFVLRLIFGSKSE